jgi:hypothetical protein
LRPLAVGYSVIVSFVPPAKAAVGSAVTMPADKPTAVNRRSVR